MAADQYLKQLVKALGRIEIPDFSAGASGYFSKPQATLDPALFYRTSHGDVIRSDVRAHVVQTLFRFWKRRGYRHPEQWATVWLAGSGISYQWAGDRGNGDLDCLIGIDWPVFYQCNPSWGHTGIEEITDFIDDELRAKLWPSTAHTEFGTKTFELTFFVNQDATDIRNINPYAAYNLSADSWTVWPSQDTAYEDDPGTPTWRVIAQNDLEQAQKIRAVIDEARARIPYAAGPQWVNATTLIAREVAYAVQLMTEIHGGRREAFRSNGKGYWDFANWRWQMAKKNGVVAVLGALERVHKAATEAAQTRQYGGPLLGADELIMRAAMRHQDVR